MVGRPDARRAGSAVDASGDAIRAVMEKRQEQERARQQAAEAARADAQRKAAEQAQQQRKDAEKKAVERGAAQRVVKPTRGPNISM